MDALTRLVQLTRPQASLDLRCQFAGAYAVPHAPAASGTAPFHLVLAGTCFIDTDAGRVQAQAGDFILFPHGGAHDIHGGSAGARAAIRTEHDGMLPLRRSGKGAAEVDLLCGHFDYAHGPGEMLFRGLPDPLHVSLLTAQDSEDGKDAEEATALLSVLVALMRQEAASRQAGALAIVTALSQALLVMALRRHAADSRSRSRDGAGGVLALLADARLGAAVQAVLKEPGRAWTIETLGAMAAMSRASFARHFSARAGISVFAFMTQVRMAVACDLLRDTRRSAGDIGMEVGYQSEAAFGKAFRQLVGVSPGQYRRQLRSDGVALG